MQQAGGPEIGPELARDAAFEQPDIGLDLPLRVGTRQHAPNARMRRDELQRRRRQRHPMLFAHRLQSARALQDRGRSGRIIVPGARDRAGRQNAGIERSARDDADIASGRKLLSGCCSRSV